MQRESLLESIEGLICVYANDAMSISSFDHKCLSFFTLSDLQPFLEVGSQFTFSKYSLRVSIGLREISCHKLQFYIKGLSQNDYLYMDSVL